MATSNSSNFTMTRNEVITDALMIIKALGEEETPVASTIDTCSRVLNRLIKHLENQAIHIWKRSEGVLFLQQDQYSYTMSSSSADHLTGTYLEKVTTVASASGAFTVTVASTTGMTNADYIGIVLNSGALQWTTIVSKTATVITLTAALTGNVSLGNTLFTYTTKLSKPLDIYHLRNYNISGKTEIELSEMAYEDYQSLSKKTTEASNPSQWTYQRNRTDGTLYVWPVPENVISYLKFTYAKPLEDVDSSSDELDMPPEWLDYIVHKLALRLYPIYGRLGSAEYLQFFQGVNFLEQEVLAFDNEKASIKIAPRRRYK